jgi:hypothetical protein
MLGILLITLLADESWQSAETIPANKYLKKI